MMLDLNPFSLVLVGQARNLFLIQLILNSVSMETEGQIAWPHTCSKPYSLGRSLHD